MKRTIRDYEATRGTERHSVHRCDIGPSQPSSAVAAAATTISLIRAGRFLPFVEWETILGRKKRAMIIFVHRISIDIDVKNRLKLEAEDVSPNINRTQAARKGRKNAVFVRGHLHL